MNKTFVIIGLGLILSDIALGQQKPAKDAIVGAWTLVSVNSEMDDGKKGEPFGPSPKGVIIFSNDGHFSLFQSRAEIPKIAANDRAKATPEEAQSIVASSIAYYGTYSIDEDRKSWSSTLLPVLTRTLRLFPIRRERLLYYPLTNSSSIILERRTA